MQSKRIRNGGDSGYVKSLYFINVQARSEAHSNCRCTGRMYDILGM